MRRGERVFFQGVQSSIINGDIFATDMLAAGSVDLAVTSPPYNVGIRYNSHDDRVTYDEYLDFSHRWMKRCHGWLKTDGRFCLNIPLDKNKGGQQSVGADLTTIAKEAGFSYHSTIVWNEGNISRRSRMGVVGQRLGAVRDRPRGTDRRALQRELEKDQRVAAVRYHQGGVHGLDQRALDVLRRTQSRSATLPRSRSSSRSAV